MPTGTHDDNNEILQITSGLKTLKSMERGRLDLLRK